jgi:Zn-dependent M28 family amino/carboxypeptidase
MNRPPSHPWRRDVRGFIVCATILGGLGSCCMFRMPGESFSGPLPPLTDNQRRLAGQLRADVELLSITIGERNIWRPESYARAAAEIEQRFTRLGYAVARHEYRVEGQRSANIEASLAGIAEPHRIVIIGAHYDSVRGTVGANDNATGVAALRAIAEALKDARPRYTLRFVAFANEEPPFFQSEWMGSVMYARACRARAEDIVAMVSLDGLGYYSDEPGSQSYPFPLNLLYPTTANFIGFVGNIASADLVKRCVGTFRQDAQFPSQGGVAPQAITGVGWSDHWSFWQAGYRAVMVTDSLPFRYFWYHTPQDTPEKIDYERMARVVDGLTSMVRDLAGVGR